MHFKGFFLSHKPNCTQKDQKKVYSFGLSECNRVKRKTIVLSKDIKIIFLQYFLTFRTVKSRHMYSEKKISKKKKVSSYQPYFLQAVT